jgi:hypothetical protein
MRMAIMRNASLWDLRVITLEMTGFAVSLLLLGMWGFNYAVKIGRREGSLTHY